MLFLWWYIEWRIKQVTWHASLTRRDTFLSQFSRCKVTTDGKEASSSTLWLHTVVWLSLRYGDMPKAAHLQRYKWANEDRAPNCCRTRGLCSPRHRISIDQTLAFLASHRINMGNAQSRTARRRTAQSHTAQNHTEQSHTAQSTAVTAQSHTALSLTPESRPQIKPLLPVTKFRVLVIGRANAGKTSILQRICETTESPIVYRGGKEVRCRVQAFVLQLGSYCRSDRLH